MAIELVYAAGYDISVFGIERLHPFDAHKPSKAFAKIVSAFGGARCVEPSGREAAALIRRVHTVVYALRAGR